jgi:hypothetical protein
MGQIVRPPVLAAGYPDTSAALDPAETLFLTAIRRWVAAYRGGEDPMPPLSHDLAAAGTRDAALSVDALMAIVARTLRQPIAIHCPRCPHISGDEKHLLHAASLAQGGDADLAAKALRTALLTAQGAEFAIGPLEGLGELFAMARLFFRRRKPASEDDAPIDQPESWDPSVPPGTIH